MSRTRRTIIVGFALLLLTMWSAAALAESLQTRTVKGPVKQVSARPPQEFRVHDVGNVWTAVGNYGAYGDPNEQYPSAEFPAGSGVFYIWEGRMWLAARVGGEPICSHTDYGNYEIYPSDNSVYYFGLGPKAIQDGWSRFDDLSEITGHTPIGFQISQRSLAWSLPDYDDFQIYYIEVKNVSGGTLGGTYLTFVYDNDVGCGPNGSSLRPSHDDLVDYDGWVPPGNEVGQPFRYDIVDPLDLDGNGDDGYDYWGCPRAWDKNYYNLATEYAADRVPYEDEFMPDNFDPEPDGIYDEYIIYQADYAPYIRYQMDAPSKGIVAGEPVINADGDTLRGYLIPRNMSYMYDGDHSQSPENDVGERQMDPNTAGFIGTAMLYHPVEPFYTTDEDTLPRPAAHQWWNIDSDPGSDAEKYQYMTATHLSSLGVAFAPHPWDYMAGSPEYDYRYLHAIGPMDNWQNNETKKFVKVTAVGWGLKGLRENIDNALEAYYTGPTDMIGDPILVLQNPGAYGDQVPFTGADPNTIGADQHFILPVPPPIPQLNYSATDGGVEMVWDNSAETTIDRGMGVVDFEGYKIYRSKYNTANWELIAAYDNVDSPVYLLNTEGDTCNPVTYDGTRYTLHDEGYEDVKANDRTQWSYEMIDLPSYVDIRNQFTDFGGSFYAADGTTTLFENVERPINGLPYYYTVAAYDPAKPDRNLSSSESARSNYRKDISGAPVTVIPRAASAGAGVVDNIQVVPNPYKGTALFEARYEDRISFINLPDRCKISIFSLTGDLIDELYKNDGKFGSVSWDLVSRNNQRVVSGLYIYVVETPEGEKKIGKFLIIR